MHTPHLNRYWGPYETFSYCYYPPNLPLSVDTVKDGKKWIMGVSAIDLPEHGTIMPDVKKVFSMPLIVPPVRNKQYARYGKIFSELWNLAEKSICECKKIFIIGYSFPDTDTVSRDMFRRAIYKNKEIEKFVIINPNSDRIVSILTKDFGVDASKIITKAAGFDIRLLENSKILDI